MVLTKNDIAPGAIRRAPDRHAALKLAEMTLIEPIRMIPADLLHYRRCPQHRYLAQHRHDNLVQRPANRSVCVQPRGLRFWLGGPAAASRRALRSLIPDLAVATTLLLPSRLSRDQKTRQRGQIVRLGLSHVKRSVRRRRRIQYGPE